MAFVEQLTDVDVGIAVEISVEIVVVVLVESQNDVRVGDDPDAAACKVVSHSVRQAFSESEVTVAINAFLAFSEPKTRNTELRSSKRYRPGQI